MKNLNWILLIMGCVLLSLVIIISKPIIEYPEGYAEKREEVFRHCLEVTKDPDGCASSSSYITNSYLKEGAFK